MQRFRLRFTIGSMMIAMAILGLLVWVVTGLMLNGAGWFSHPPLYLLIAYPFLFAACITFVVTLVQFRSERRLPARDRNDETAPGREP